MNKQGTKTYNIYVRRDINSNRFHRLEMECEKEFLLFGEKCFVHHQTQWGDEKISQYFVASHIKTGLAISKYCKTVEEAIKQARKIVKKYGVKSFKKGIACSLKARKAANP